MKTITHQSNHRGKTESLLSMESVLNLKKNGSTTAEHGVYSGLLAVQNRSA
jgi:hypothetical protein